MSFKDIGEKVDNTKSEITTEYKKNTLFKYASWVIGGLVILILIIVMFRGCSSSSNTKMYSYQQPSTQQVYQEPIQQPMYPTNVNSNNYSGTDMAIATAAGALGGYIAGRSRMPDGSIYNGSESQKQMIVKKYYISHPRPNVVTANNITPSPKIKNPGDVEAEKQNQLMKQEAKTNKDRMIAERKASIMKNRNIAAKSGYSKSYVSTGSKRK